MEVGPFDLPPIVKDERVATHPPFSGSILTAGCIWIAFYNLADGTNPDFCSIEMFVTSINDVLDFFSDSCGNESLLGALPYFAEEGSVEG